MSNELLGILTGKSAPTATAPGKTAKTYEPYDAAVRTVLAEESDPTAQDWVAGVIANRAKKSGKNFYEVVTEENQFEPWARGTAQAVDPGSKEYKAAAARVRDILDGKRDPSEGAMNFYAPEAQAELAAKDGRSPKAEFDDDTGVRVGKTLFFRPAAVQGGSELTSVLGVQADPEAMKTAEADFAKSFGDPAKYEEKAELTSGTIPFREIKGGKVDGVLSKEQEELYKALNKGGGYKPNDPEGSPYNMLFMQEGISEKDIPPGSYYVTRAGEFKRAAGGEQKDGSALKGFGQGAADVALSVANAFPGSGDSTIKNRLLTDQMVYDADHKGELVAGLGRFAGQAVTAAPALAGAEAAALPLIGGSAIGRFALGKAGTEMAPGVAQMATKLASRITQGAAEGAGGAALVSSASDEPLADQLKTGAIVGGVLRPAVPLAAKAGEKVGGAVRDFVEPWTHAGREKGVERILGKVGGDDVKLDLRELVPGSKPTMAEASGNAGLATLERNARTNPQLVERFNERLRDNAAARKDFFGSIAKDGEAVEEARVAREAATGKLRDDAFKKAKPADPAPVVAKIEEILQSPSGKRDTVVAALKGLPDKLTGETDVAQLYGIRKDIGDLLDPRASSDKKGAQLAASELMAVKAEIDKAIEKAAPGFKGYLKTYADMSKPIDEMQYLQSLNLADSKGFITLSKVQTAIDRIEKAQKAGGVNKPKSISKETMEGLKALRDDLKRSGNIDLGKARGSDTVQNAAMGRFAADEGMPILGNILGAKVPGAALAIGMGKKALEGKSAKAVDQLASRLLYPETPLKNVSVKKRPPMIPVGDVALPVIGGQFSSSVGANK